MTKRVTFHHAPTPGPAVSALIAEHASSEVVVQRQHFIHKRQIAHPWDDTKWYFEREKLTESLEELRETFSEDERDDENPQFATLMLDLEPHWENLGHSRLDVMQDALGLCHTILGQRVQVGFQGNPHQRGLNDPSTPPIRIYDSILAMQGAIFIHPRFTNKGGRWFEKGMILTRALIGRVCPIRDHRPVIAFIWPRHSTGHWLIPDSMLIEQILLLTGNAIEISVFGPNDEETAHVIELARSVQLQEKVKSE